jgi:tetratricopeptide (TPR) repeat protein
VRLISLMAIALAAILSTGCGDVRPARGDRAIFNDGLEAYDAAQWQRAVNNFTEYLQSAPPETHGEIYYMRGMAEVRLHKRDDARRDFQKSIDAKPRYEIESYAYAALGNLYYEEGNDQRAVEAYAKAIKNPPKELPIDQVILRLAVSLQRTGRFAAADKYFEHLIDHYSGTASGIEAARRVHVTAYTIQTGAFLSPVTAQGEVDRLRAAGFPARITKTTRGAQSLNAVQVGRYRTYLEAAEAAQRMARVGFTPLIVP